MNRWFCGVIAAIACGSVASAGTGSDDWMTLDEEIDRLASSQPVQNVGPSVGALLRPVFDYEEGDDDEGEADIAGFSLHEADAWLEGSVGNTAWRLSADFASGEDSVETELEDAYGLIGLTEQVGLTFGQYKNPILHSSRIDPENQMLFVRPWIADTFDFWDQGAMVDFSSGQFGGYFSVQNGVTGIEAIHSYMARVEFFLNAMTGGMLWSKRTTGKLPDNVTMIGAFHYEDDVDADAQVNGLDVAANFNTWRVEAEVIDVDENAPTGFGAIIPDSTPWDVGGQFMINQNFDVAARYQDADDDADTTGLTVGLDYYPGDPTVFWSVEVDVIDSDDDGLDGEAFRVGLTLGASRTR
jgi:hypothetical protein